MHLISPSVELFETYQEFLDDFELNHEELVPWVLSLKTSTFNDLICNLADFSKGIGVKQGFVPHSTFWLVDSGRKIVGVSNLRHELTPSLMREGGHIGFGVRPSERGKGYATRLLELTLLEAKKLDINDIFVTCDRNNKASARVIEKNGGVFDSEIESNDGNFTKRFWINL